MDKNVLQHNRGRFKMIGKIITFIIGFIVGTLFGTAIGEWILGRLIDFIRVKGGVI